MAKVSVDLIDALRRTARHINQHPDYQWGHMGACNCGFLAQEVTHLTKKQIHERAMLGHGDWTEQLNDYCTASGLPMDNVISELLAFGFDIDDLRHLERLSDQRVLNTLPPAERHLRHNQNGDAVKYLLAWADLLEHELLERIRVTLPEPAPVAIL